MCCWCYDCCSWVIPQIHLSSLQRRVSRPLPWHQFFPWVWMISLQFPAFFWQCTLSLDSTQWLPIRFAWLASNRAESYHCPTYHWCTTIVPIAQLWLDWVLRKVILPTWPFQHRMWEPTIFPCLWVHLESWRYSRRGLGWSENIFGIWVLVPCPHSPQSATTPLACGTRPSSFLGFLLPLIHPKNRSDLGQ